MLHGQFSCVIYVYRARSSETSDIEPVIDCTLVCVCVSSSDYYRSDSRIPLSISFSIGGIRFRSSRFSLCVPLSSISYVLSTRGILRRVTDFPLIALMSSFSFSLSLSKRDIILRVPSVADTQRVFAGVT